MVPWVGPDIPGSQVMSQGNLHLSLLVCIVLSLSLTLCKNVDMEVWQVLVPWLPGIGRQPLLAFPASALADLEDPVVVWVLGFLVAPLDVFATLGVLWLPPFFTA